MRKLLLLILLLNQTVFAQIRTFSGHILSATEVRYRVKHVMDSLRVSGMSMAIINDGKIVFNQGFGYMDMTSKRKASPATFFEAASMSKPAFAVYVLTLAHQGRLNLDTPLYRYLPYADIDDERYKRITARMVLSHTSGLPNWRETDKMKLAFEPGKKFSYSGEGYLYLAKVVAHLTGHTLKNLDEDFQHEIARPWGLKDFHFVITHPARQNEAIGYQGTTAVKDDRDRQAFDPAGGMYATSTNYARFLICLINKQADYREMFQKTIELDQNELIRQYFGVEAWSEGLAMINLGGVINYWHGGNNLGYTNSFMINPDKRFGYVFFTNQDQCHSLKKAVEQIIWR